MNKERKINKIKALEEQIRYYKRLSIPVKTIYQSQLEHIKFNAVLSRYEVMNIPEDMIKDILIHKLLDDFFDKNLRLPFKVMYDENLQFYKATLDLWVTR